MKSHHARPIATSIYPSAKLLTELLPSCPELVRGKEVEGDGGEQPGHCGHMWPSTNGTIRWETMGNHMGTIVEDEVSIIVFLT